MLFRLSEQKSFVVHLQPGSDPAHHASNYIIRELARINNKRADRTGYSFTFDVEVQLTRRGNRLVTRVNMDNFRFRGDYSYMGFDMADVLLPFVDFKLELRQGRTHVTTFEQRAKVLEKGWVMDNLHVLFYERGLDRKDGDPKPRSRRERRVCAEVLDFLRALRFYGVLCVRETSVANKINSPATDESYGTEGHYDYGN